LILLGFGPFQVHANRRELLRDGQPIAIQAKLFDTLVFLLERRDRVVDKRELLDQIWPDVHVEESTLFQTVSALRKVLGCGQNGARYIATIPGRGYQFVAAAVVVEHPLPRNGVNGAQAANGGAAPALSPAETETLSSPRLEAFAPGDQSPTPSRLAARPETAVANTRDRRRFAAISALTVLALAGAYGAGWRVSRSGAPAALPLRKLAVQLDHAVGEAAISPNGRYLAYTQVKSAVHGIGSLWVRDLETGQTRHLIAEPIVRHAMWSPDSETLAFSAVEPPGGRQSVGKIGVRGGPRIKLWDRNVAFTGGVWSPDGESIVFASRPAALYELSARGGEPVLLYRPAETAKDVGYFHPSWLPGLGRRALVFSRATRIEDAEMMLYRPGSDEAPTQLGKGFSPTWASGCLLHFGNKGDFWAMPFSLRSLAPTGDAFPIAAVPDMQGPSVADDGTLVFVRVDQPSQMQLVWRDRSGRRIENVGEPLTYMSKPTISPDGRSIALSGGNHFGDDIWIQTLSPAKLTRLTFADGRDSGPIWSPDGKSVLFNSYRNGTPDVFLKSVDGVSGAEELFPTEAHANPQDWSRDGRYILYATGGDGQGDLWYVERTAGGWSDPRVFLQTPAAERAAAFSPNGRFVAYVSNESGRDEIHVRPFPPGEGRWQISRRGGAQPVWSRAGSELFYVEGDTLTAVAVETASDFAAGEPRSLFSQAHLGGLYPVPNYDVHPDGNRFILVDEGANAKASIQIVQNWHEEFRRMSGWKSHP